MSTELFHTGAKPCAAILSKRYGTALKFAVCWLARGWHLSHNDKM